MLDYKGEIDPDEDLFIDTGANFNIINIKKLKNFDFKVHVLTTNECEELTNILKLNDLPKMKELNPDFSLEFPQ